MKGIYKITNTINNKVYIGESLNIETRWQEHIESLNNNTHHSYKLQEDWNVHEKENFKFEILEEIDPDNNYKQTIQKIINIYLENKYITQYNSINDGYNVENTFKLILKGEKNIFGEQYKNLHRKEIETSIFRSVIKNLKENNDVYIAKKKSKPKIQKNKKLPIYKDFDIIYNTRNLKYIINKCKNYKFKDEFEKMSNVFEENGFRVCIVNKILRDINFFDSKNLCLINNDNMFKSEEFYVYNDETQKYYTTYINKKGFKFLLNKILVFAKDNKIKVFTNNFIKDNFVA